MNKKLQWNISKSITRENEEHKKKEEIRIKTSSLMDLMERYLMQSDIQENSKKTYFKGLKNFIQWAYQKNREENQEDEENGGEIFLSKDLLVVYKNNLMQSHIKPHTQAVYLVSLKQFFVWTEANLIFPNIAREIRGIRKITKQHHKDPVKKEDIVKLLIKKESQKNNIIESRNYAIVNLLILTGMRIGETTHIQIEDIELINEEKTIIWIKGKGRSGKDSFIVLLKESIEAINEYLNLRKISGEKIHDKSFLFVSHSNRKKENSKIHTDSISRIVKEKMKEMQIKTKRISPHSLRHTYGILAIKAGISLHELQLSMRHSTPNTTQVYLGDIEKEKRKEGRTEQTIIDFLKTKKD